MRRELFILVVTLLCACPLLAQDIEDNKAKSAKIEEEIKLIDSQLTKTDKSINSRTQALSLTRRKIDQRKKLLKEIDATLKKLNLQIEAKQKEITELEKEHQMLMESYSHLLYAAYKNRNTYLPTMYVFGSKDIVQAWRRWRYFKAMSAKIKEKVNQIREAEEKLSLSKQELEGLKTEQEGAKGKQKKELNSLQGEEKQSNGMINKMKKEKNALLAQMKQKKIEYAALQDAIKRAIEKDLKKDDVKSAANEALSAEFAGNMGKLPWPVEHGVVVEGFGSHKHPVLKNITLPFNNGINISVNEGAVVKAVFGGTVSSIVSIAGYGKCVLLSHGGFYTFYCNLQQVTVTQGEKVSTGMSLGIAAPASGTTGTGLLHFEIWKGTEKQNPELWLR